MGMSHVVVWVPRASLYRTKVSGEISYVEARATAKRWAQSTEFCRDDHLGIYLLGSTGSDNLLSMSDLNGFISEKSSYGLIQNGPRGPYGGWPDYYRVPVPTTPVKDTAVIIQPPSLQASEGDME